MDQGSPHVRRPTALASLRLAIAALLLTAATAQGVRLANAGSQRAASALAAPAAASSTATHARPGIARFRPGVVLLAFHQGVPAARRQAIERGVGGFGARLIGPRVPPARLGRAARPLLAPIELRVGAHRVLAAVRRLRDYGAVAYAQPDYLMQASAVPNDSFFALQWADSNSGQSVPTTLEPGNKLGPPENGTPGADDRALPAWEVTTGSASIVIGEADTGVDYEHPDLAANIWSNPGGVGGCPAGTHGYNVRAEHVLPQACEPMDNDATYGGHGTHVAGIIGAVGNNGTGVAGVNWNTSILPVKWLDSASGGSTANLVEALRWLVAAKQAGVNVRVVNDSATLFGTQEPPMLSEAIRLLGEHNILFVTAAGNTGQDNDVVNRFPCDFRLPNEICVTASNDKDQLPSWANYGSQSVDLAAPGVSIYSTLEHHTYGYISGGSMASPQVAGAAALILSVEPSLSAEQLKADIVQHVDVVPSLSGRVISGGRLDICRALPGCPRPAEATTSSGAPSSATQAVLPPPSQKPVPDAELASRTLFVSSSGTVTVEVTCPRAESDCKGTVTLRARVPASAAASGGRSTRRATLLTLAVGSFTVAGGHVKRVRMRLSAKARKLLKHAHVLHAQATIVAHDPTGATHAVTRSVTLRPLKLKRSRGAHRR
jgi:thermitase